MIVEIIKQVEENIKQACEKVGRNPEEVKQNLTLQLKKLYLQVFWTMVKIKYRNFVISSIFYLKISDGI